MLKWLLRRYRSFMQAEIMEELRKRDELAKQMESALLTIALLKTAEEGEKNLRRPWPEPRTQRRVCFA